MKTVIKIALPLLLLNSGVCLRTMANVYVVSNTLDAGVGSLRQAITDANSNAGKDTIQFQILPSGNLFEGTAPNTYAVIQIDSELPVITSPLFIDGSSQTDTNTGSVAGPTAGVDNITLSAIPYPDIYLVPSVTYIFPTNSTGVTGNGLSIDAADVTIKGLAISGFGNTHTNGGTASGHSDLSVLRSPVERIMNTTITNCFFSCDPLGNFPSLSYRRSKSNGILVTGNNLTGTISNNYIAYSGTYGIHFNGNTDNLNVGPLATTIGNRGWIVSGNQLINITTNPLITTNTRVSDGINLMKCVGFRVTNNYINNAEQMGIDLGYNSDSNYVCNNTVTDFVQTTAYQVQAGLRIGLCSEGDTLIKNVVFNNSGSLFKAGVWLDRSTLTQTGIVTKSNTNSRIQENHIFNNTGSGVVISTNSTGECMNNVITRNSIYNNTGLGIDLSYNGTVGPTQVTPNDDSDVDAGVNNIQNFPIIDSVRRFSATTFGFYGKAPSGSTIEFFITDLQENKHGGFTLNYGEGKTFMGSAVEGGPEDGASGTGSYNIDGNISVNNANLFFFTLTYTGTISVLDSITSTATVAGNTSEFGPVVNVLEILNCSILSFSSSLQDNTVKLSWKAVHDNSFRFFDIEHSLDGKSFSRLRTINPKNNGELSDYEFLHHNAQEDKHFYRLRMVNSAGRGTYSSTVYLDLTKKSVNPIQNMNSFFTDQIQLRLKSEREEDLAIHLFNESGKLVRHKQLHGKPGMNFIQFDNLEGLAAGTYILHIRKPGEILTRKVVKL